LNRCASKWIEGAMSNDLFDPLRLRDVTLRNRIGVSPMCQYSSEDGLASDWHLVHLGSRAVGGAGLVMVEATAVEPRGRITGGDLGIWGAQHVAPLARIAHFIESQGAVPGIQLAHAGRKGSKTAPWQGDRSVDPAHGGYVVDAPSAVPFAEGWQVPHALTVDEIHAVTQRFVDAAVRAREAGFKLIELHAAHGYLAHSFLSPLSNRRTDAYGGSFENRVRFVLETVRALRAAWPGSLPLAVRLSCTDWVDHGWTLDESVELSKLLTKEGVDLIDCSSGGNSPLQKPALGSGYQVPFAAEIRKRTGAVTAAVGLIGEPAQADQIVGIGQADLVLLARAELRDPYFPLHAAQALDRANRLHPPVQYERAFPRHTK
jgi:2,4-dienoyl-CoA reductase-like NADH-dependent reductase (Old Yellow Enzyme family)